MKLVELPYIYSTLAFVASLIVAALVIWYLVQTKKK